MSRKNIVLCFLSLFFEMIILLSIRLNFNFVTVIFALVTTVINIVFIPLIYSIILKYIGKLMIKKQLSVTKCFAFIMPYIFQKVIFASIDIVATIMCLDRIYIDVIWIVLDVCTTAIVTFKINNELKLNIGKSIFIYLIFFVLNLIIH